MFSLGSFDISSKEMRAEIPAAPPKTAAEQRGVLIFWKTAMPLQCCRMHCRDDMLGHFQPTHLQRMYDNSHLLQSIIIT